jgi:hypothetical protein
MAYLPQNSPKSWIFKRFFYYTRYKLEVGRCITYLHTGKIYICGLAEVLSSQITKRLGPQIANPQSVTFAKSSQSDKIFESANLRICDSQNLFADPLLHCMYKTLRSNVFFKFSVFYKEKGSSL